MSNTVASINQAALRQLLKVLQELRQSILQQSGARLASYSHFDENAGYPSGAVNLAQYLALRSFDLRELQDQLSALGISSLGRGESGIVDNLDRVITLLCAILDEASSVVDDAVASGESGRALLKHNAETLFGPSPNDRGVHIMVTLPATAADDYALVRTLVENGMNCARINCAHDDEEVWLAMIYHVRKAMAESGKLCNIMMDLAGQKVRTMSIEAGPGVYHLKAKRDCFGAVVEPGYLQLVAESRFGATTDGKYYQLAVADEMQSKLQIGDCLHFRDHRGKRRRLDIMARDEAGNILACSWQGAYITKNTRFRWRNKRAKNAKTVDIEIAGLQTSPVKIRLFKDDYLLLTSGERAGGAACFDCNSTLREPAHIGISHSEILPLLKPGDPVWIDDGKIGTVVESVTSNGVLLRVSSVRSQGALVREGKGVNFPETELRLSPLTDKDLHDLDFICRHADMLAYSFVQCRDDIQLLQAELDRRGVHNFPIIAKIETNKAVKNLPEIMLSAIDRQPLGVMIARGDLAIELGSVRMAEIQEEILWLCEAAHVPVVWATQVLETLAKEGIQSRPEVTDAAMSVRAECVMLNKGPYIIETLSVLNNILKRMSAHQRKKSSRLRALKQWSFQQSLPLRTDSPSSIAS